MQHCLEALPSQHMHIRQLRVHMEQVDILVGSTTGHGPQVRFCSGHSAPAVPSTALWRPSKQSPGGVADNLREHRELLPLWHILGS